MHPFRRTLLATLASLAALSAVSSALAQAYPKMTGANIRNAVVAAAFLAAAEDQAITHHHLERGARAEYLAMGRMISDRRN